MCGVFDLIFLENAARHAVMKNCSKKNRRVFFCMPKIKQKNARTTEEV